MRKTLKSLEDVHIHERLNECMAALRERYGHKIECEIRDMAPEIEAADLASACTFALRRAAVGWDPSKAQFLTYVKSGLRNAIITAKRQAKARQRREVGDGPAPISLDGPAKGVEDDDVSVGETIADDGDLESDVVDRMGIEQSDYAQRVRVETAIERVRASVGALWAEWDWVAMVLEGLVPERYRIATEADWVHLMRANRHLMVRSPERGDLVLRGHGSETEAGIILSVDPYVWVVVNGQVTASEDPLPERCLVFRWRELV